MTWFGADTDTELPPAADFLTSGDRLTAALSFALDDPYGSRSAP
ncbi:hypothetical protein ACFV5J_26275 [Streptomyces zaomyceticus]